jgi:hypothetical protein
MDEIAYHQSAVVMHANCTSRDANQEQNKRQQVNITKRNLISEGLCHNINFTRRVELLYVPNVGAMRYPQFQLNI